MFIIDHIKNEKGELNYLELKSSNGNTKAIIYPKLGGSLQQLTLKNRNIIKAVSSLEYKKTYASAILFPFANRLENGSYVFQKKQHTLEINHEDENNAIHGLVYNKQFKVINKQITSDSATIKLAYNENNRIKGFPFKYSISLIYTLTSDILKLDVIVKNNDDHDFPFGLGWHPYFWSDDLYNSCVKIKSNKRLIVNESKIPIKFDYKSQPEELLIKDQTFDNCFVLNNNIVGFKTPDYDIDISFSSKESYVQLYTPKDRKNIAIEPLTSPSNSFNNKIGLQILKSEDIYNLNWTIKLNYDYKK